MLIFQTRFFCCLFLFLFFFFIFSLFLFFFNVKYGRTPLFIAAFNGDEQTVEILLEKGNPNVDLPDNVLLLFVFFFFSVSHFSIFLNVKNGRTPLYVAARKGHEHIVQILLEKGNPNVDLSNNVLLLIVFFFFFSVFHFSIFFNVKDGETPLYIAAEEGDEQIVQILLEKGNPNVDLGDEVIVLFVIILNLLILFLQSLQWSGVE